ncbi:MAG TPA: hypothetical protein VK745_13920 [Polyangiaceae bacterium]|jgi:hypothetical protein|nr:hypothetical protein [Polyangiaceae bacterium]
MLRTFEPTLSLYPSLILALTVLGWAVPAAAQDSNAAIAESLFRDGKRLSAEHKFAEACPKFAESYKLDPGLGTLLNLATCHEAEGKPASAWAEFSEASSRARREGDNDRAQLADEHVRALEPKLAHISIALAGVAPAGLVIKFDGRELSSAALGVQFPVDPGQHQIEAAAPGKQSYSQTIGAPGPAGAATITVPQLQDAPGAAAPVSAAVGVPVAPAAATAAPPARSGPSHTAVIASGVATGVFLVGAVTTGILYSGDRSSFNTANSTLAGDRVSKHDSAATMGTVNLVFSAGTLVSAGLLVYFLATQSSQEAAPAARLQVLPVIASTGGGLEVRGAL